MSRKSSIRKKNHFIEEHRQQHPKRRSRNKEERERSLQKVERYHEDEGTSKRKIKANKDTIKTFSRKRPTVSQRVQSERRIPKQRVSAGYSKYNQRSTEKSPAIVVFSVLSNLFFYSVTIGIIVMALMFSFSSKSSASIFGYRFYTVLTNSMVPQENGPKGGFYAGDIVIIKMTDGNSVKKNDIVTFAVGDGSRYLTHRLVEHKDELNGEKGKFLITKGDANKSNDPPIPADRVLGKVIIAVPKVGMILDFIRDEFWACLVSVLSLYGSVLVLKAYLFSPKEKLVRKDKRMRRPIYDR
jgi:signal peptidase